MGQYANKDCALHETEYCRRLHMPNCNACPAHGPGGTNSIKEDLDEIAKLLPAADLSSLFHSESCVLCKQDPQPRACYAMEDLGNPEPVREGRNFLGLKTKMRVGSLLPVQLSCCASCRRKHRILSYLPIMAPLAAAIIMLVLLGSISLREKLINTHPVLPLALFLVVVGGVALGASLLRNALLKRYDKVTYINVMEQPFLAQMGERGWFELQRGKGMSHLVFSKEGLKQGLYTR